VTISTIAFAVIIIVALGVGWLTAKFGNRFLPRVFVGPDAKPLVSTYAIVACIVGLASFQTFNGLKKTWPALDDVSFTASENFRFARTQTEIPSGVCPSLPCVTASTDPRNDISITVQYRPRVAKQDDFQVVLEFSSNPDVLREDVYSAVLYAPKHVERRTTHRCAPPDVEGFAGVRACDKHRIGSTFRLVWDVTPTQTGTATVRITSDLFGVEPPMNTEREYRVSRRFGRPDKLEQFPGGQSKIAVADVTLDLPAREIRFPVEVITSLGVSQKVYDGFALASPVVAILGTLFGAGFFSRAFAQRKKKTKEAKKATKNVPAKKSKTV
jgi:hypothetical protein